MSDTADTPGRSGFFQAFIDHPASVNETYLQHMRFAGWFAMMLIGAGLAALVHAIIPPLFETTASRIIHRLHARIAQRHHDA